MAKDPRDHTKWTNQELEEDSAGYLAAQEAYRSDQEAAEAWRREEQALRDERATEAARSADEEASRAQRGTVMGVV
jgi:hypothetical protein